MLLKRNLIVAILTIVMLSGIGYSEKMLVSFWGTVEIDSSPAPAGVYVSVHNETGTVRQVQTFIYNGTPYYILDIKEEGLVYFKIAGVNSTHGFYDIGYGGSVNLNLSMNTLADGEPCQYDIACTSGICIGGICRPPGYTTTTTVDGGGVSSTGGSGSTSSSGAGFYKSTTTTTTDSGIVAGPTTTLPATTTTVEATTVPVMNVTETTTTVMQQSSPGLVTGFFTLVSGEPLTFVLILISLGVISLLLTRFFKPPAVPGRRRMKK